jgi:hypothetical protein
MSNASLLKDGDGNEFSIRTKDVSVTQNNSLRQNWHMASDYPIDHSDGGSFQLLAKSGALIAGLAANAPIISFRFASTALCAIVRRIKLQAWTNAVGFTAGPAAFDLYPARSFSVEDTGGLLAAISGNTGKMRTSGMASSAAHLRVSDTGALGLGTRALDAQPSDSLIVAAATTINTVFLPTQVLFQAADHPLVLDNLEGFVVQASVPATGTWSFAVHVAWDEVQKASY